MVDPLPYLSSLKNSYEKLDKSKKKHLILFSIILVLSVGWAFYFFPENEAYAQYVQSENQKNKIKLEAFDPLSKIGKGIQEERAENFSKNEMLEKKEENPDKYGLRLFLSGFPMEEMIHSLNEEDREVAAYLVAIAKKESDWGKHAPKKSGRDCYNYWGYKGGKILTTSGYGCFESPKQAVSVVGGKIKKLLEKEIDTPSELVVWKCGSSCSGHNGKDVKKWISDVSAYHSKVRKRQDAEQT